jgi:hypothetical protein
MKKLIKITESDLSNIVRRVILEMMDDSPKKLSFDGWSDVWRKLRKQYGDSFQRPDDFGQNRDFPIFSAMHLDFVPKNDGEYLEIMDFHRDLKNWSDDSEKGFEILTRVENRLRDRIENSDADLRFDTNDSFRFRIYKK